MRTLSYDQYLDKVLGGWIGKCAGGILGAPVEGYKRFNDIKMSDELFDTNYPNDDLDLQVLWLDMVKKKGPYVRERDFGDHWKNHVQFPWGEYGVAGRNLKLGIYPPQSGEHNNWYWKTGMGSPIRSEIWGMLNPGMPIQAAYYAGLDSSLDHDDFSVDAERFLSAMAAEAFFEHDIMIIMETVSQIFEHDCPFTDLLDYALELYGECSYDIAIRKMKSRYGDADFTNAPMNVGFALLTMMYQETSFDNLIHALNLGHDSDCIAATVGGLYGIIIGASNLEPKWRRLVRDELLVSPEIVGIEHPDTLTDLANETCRAGLSFIEFFKHIQITGKELKPYTLSPHLFNVNTIFVDYEPGMLVDEQRMDVEYENLTDQLQHVVIEFSSDDLEFSEPILEFDIEGIDFKSIQNKFAFLPESYDELISVESKIKKTAYTFNIDVTINGEQQERLVRGVPFYGAWLMIGPFIQDDLALEPMDPTYPDHGLASMPSCQYMNHDKLDLNTEYIEVDTARRIAAENSFEDYPFQIEPFNPAAMKMNLNDYFKGRGEKTIYLYSKVHSTEAKKIWLVMGCSAYIRVWWNGDKVFERRDIHRDWPYDIAIEAELNKGENDILIRIDMPIDHVDFEFGFKEHVGKHPHQSHWDVELAPFV